MAKNDGLIAVALLFGAALLWNYRGSITDSLVTGATDTARRGFDWGLQQAVPWYGYYRRTQKPAGSDEPSSFTPSGGGGGLDGQGSGKIPAVTTRPKSYSKTKEEARARIWTPAPAASTGTIFKAGGGAGVRGSTPAEAVKTALRNRLYAPRPFEVGAVSTPQGGVNAAGGENVN